MGQCLERKNLKMEETQRPTTVLFDDDSDDDGLSLTMCQKLCYCFQVIFTKLSMMEFSHMHR